MSDKKKEPEAPKIRREYLVLGRFETSKGELLWGIHPIGSRDELAALLTEVPNFQLEAVGLYKGLKGIRAGTIVSYEGSENGKSITPSSLLFVDHVDDKVATAWQIRDRAIVDAKKLLKKAKRNLPFECLDPWRKILSRSMGERRVMILARLLNYVERGVK